MDTNKKVIFLMDNHAEDYNKGIELEKTSYEVQACENLLLFLNHNTITNNIHYLRLWGEFIYLYDLHQQTKQKFEREIVLKYVTRGYRLVKWNYNFNNGELIIYEL